ncbi:MAG: ankyrin repeat domain-containing protein [Ilumatobacteraceae bacterium]
MSQLPARPDLDQLRRIAKDRVRAARAGDPAALQWIGALDTPPTLAAAQLRLARDHGFTSWAALLLEVARRRVLDLRQPEALASFLDGHPEAATVELTNWRDHPRGATPLAYVAMARFDTTSGAWRDVTGTAAMAHVLVAAGAPVDGAPDDRETPLITAASYGDAEVASVLIAAGADIDATAAADAGGVPGGSALLHAAVFGMSDVVDVLVAAGARVRSLEEAAAAGNLAGWSIADADVQTRLRALIMAAHHERLHVIDALAEAGTPIDDEDHVFRRHPLRLAAASGRAAGVRHLLARGADPTRRDDDGRTALDHCRHGRLGATDTTGYDEIERMLTP